MATRPIHQHIVPRVYLKQFCIDDLLHKGFVYCVDFTDPYRQGIQKRGLNDKLFTLKKFYNDPRCDDPFIIEKVLAQDIEPKYHAIMECLRTELALPVPIREDILSWLYFTQIRAPHLRENMERVMGWIFEMTHRYHQHEPSLEETQLLKDYVKRSAREIHLEAFSDKEQASELLRTHIETLNAKHWKILKSPEGYPFLTSDNPGFSPNQHPQLAHHTPFHRVMELNAHSVIYFVFSPHYCLEIRPYFEGTPLELCALNMDIRFEPISKHYTDFINEGVFYSRHRLVISSSKDQLNRYLRRFKKSSTAAG